jgi:hypothetical protein
MNGKNRGNLRFSQIGTHPAEMSASPITGQRKHQGSGNKIMTYEAANVRNALVAVTIAFLASAVLMAGAVGPAIA